MTDVFDELESALSIAKAAKLARICTKTLRDHVAAGRIRVLKIGGKTLIPINALRDFVQSVPVASN